MYHYLAKPIDLPFSNRLECIIDLGFEKAIQTTITIHGIPLYQPGSDDERECVTLIRNAILDYPINLKTTKDEDGGYGAWVTVIDDSHYGLSLSRYMTEQGYGLEEGR